MIPQLAISKPRNLDFKFIGIDSVGKEMRHTVPKCQNPSF